MTFFSIVVVFMRRLCGPVIFPTRAFCVAGNIEYLRKTFYEWKITLQSSHCVNWVRITRWCTNAAPVCKLFSNGINALLIKHVPDRIWLCDCIACLNRQRGSVDAMPFRISITSLIESITFSRTDSSSLL